MRANIAAAVPGSEIGPSGRVRWRCWLRWERELWPCRGFQTSTRRWLRSSDRLTLGQTSAGQLGQRIVVMQTFCCCPLELSGRRPHVRQHPWALSASRQARAIRPAPKLALWAGTPVRARVGLTGRNRTRRTHAPSSSVCVCSIRSFGRPMAAPLSPVSASRSCPECCE